MAAAPRPAASQVDEPDAVVVLPAALAEEFERPTVESRDRTMPLKKALSEFQRIESALSMPGGDVKPNNVRYVDAFTADSPQPVRAERGDFELSYVLPGFFGSTFEAILRKNRNAHRIYVHIAGLRVTVRVHRLPYWAQANNIIASVANEAEKRGVRFLPFQALVDATDENEELCALQALEPDFVFTPAAVAPEETGASLLDQFTVGKSKALTPSCAVLFWAIQGTADNTSAQIRVWSTVAPEKEKAKEKEKAAAATERAPVVLAAQPVAPPPLGVFRADAPKVKQEPEVPIIVTVRSLVNKKRRGNEDTMSM